MPFGTEVTIIEMMPNLLPVEDDDVSDAITKSYRKAGINCLTDTKVTGTLRQRKARSPSPSRTAAVAKKSPLIAAWSPSG
jgi:pyruvate/2-oxoglutarate dehydrogenase complex dihydrolipoamide dehydrogenase (E3) component